MTWFTASVLIAIKPEGYVSGSIQVYENMYLIEASTAHDASRKAEALGRQEASITADDLTIDDKPATRASVACAARTTWGWCSATPTATVPSA